MNSTLGYVVPLAMFMACLCLCLHIVYILIFVLQSWSYTNAAIFFHCRNNGSMPCVLKPAKSFSEARRTIQIADKQRRIIIIRRKKVSLFILISCIYKNDSINANISNILCRNKNIAISYSEFHPSPSLYD